MALSIACLKHTHVIWYHQIKSRVTDTTVIYLLLLLYDYWVLVNPKNIDLYITPSKDAKKYAHQKDGISTEVEKP